VKRKTSTKMERESERDLSLPRVTICQTLRVATFCITTDRGR
jgi:hypothetical protein